MGSGSAMAADRRFGRPARGWRGRPEFQQRLELTGAQTADQLSLATHAAAHCDCELGAHRGDDATGDPAAATPIRAPGGVNRPTPMPGLIPEEWRGNPCRPRVDTSKISEWVSHCVRLGVPGLLSDPSR